MSESEDRYRALLARYVGRTNEELAELLQADPVSLRMWRGARRKVPDQYVERLMAIPVIPPKTHEEIQAEKRQWKELVGRAVKASGNIKRLADRTAIRSDKVRRFYREGQLPKEQYLWDLMERIAAMTPPDDAAPVTNGRPKPKEQADPEKPKGAGYFAKPSWSARTGPIIARFWRKWRKERADRYVKAKEMESAILEELAETVALCKAARG